MNNVLIIYHRIDIDGWLSAAIIDRHYRTSNVEEVILHGYNYGDKIDIKELTKNFNGNDTIVMTDVSLDIDDMEFLINHPCHFIYIDHHTAKVNEVLALDSASCNFYYSVNTANEPANKQSACELTWSYFNSNEAVPEVIELAGAYDCFRHKSYTDEDADIVLTYQYGLRTVIYDVVSAYDILDKYMEDNHILTVTILKQGSAIYDSLKIDAIAVYDKGFDLTLRGIDVKCVNKERFNPINFGIDYHKDGYDAFLCFWYDGNTWAFSLYNDDDTVDCSVIAKAFGGGGHKGASGFRVKDITAFTNTHKNKH